MIITANAPAPARMVEGANIVCVFAAKSLQYSVASVPDKEQLTCQYLSEFVGVSQYLAGGDVIESVQVRTFDISRGLKCFARHFGIV